MKNNLHSVPLAQSYLLLNHGPVTLVTSAPAGHANVMAAAWAMPLDFDPAKVLLVIDKQTLTREFVDATGEFALNILGRDLADKVLAAASEPNIHCRGAETQRLHRDKQVESKQWILSGLSGFLCASSASLRLCGGS
jgi:flavin reductase (DIM6/NTAB) family NADH-FMN oxidoreductase RutF